MPDEYSKQVYKGKDSKGLPVFEPKTYVRASKEFRQLYAHLMASLGLTEVIKTPLRTGECAISYVAPLVAPPSPKPTQQDSEFFEIDDFWEGSSDA